jgi:hypothetical protein
MTPHGPVCQFNSGFAFAGISPDRADFAHGRSLRDVNSLERRAIADASDISPTTGAAPTNSDQAAAPGTSKHPVHSGDTGPGSANRSKRPI